MWKRREEEGGNNDEMKTHVMKRAQTHKLITVTIIYLQILYEFTQTEAETHLNKEQVTPQEFGLCGIMLFYTADDLQVSHA